MKLFLKLILKYYLVLIINALIQNVPIKGLRELVSCLLSSFIIISIYKTYKETCFEDSCINSTLKGHISMFLLSCLVFLSYTIAEAGLLSFFVPDYDREYNFKNIDMINAVIFAPIAEEILFRGVLLKQINIKRTFIIANLVQASLFSLLHFDIYTFIFSLSFGMVLGVIYKYLNIFCCILIHALNNLLVVITVTLRIESLQLRNFSNLVIGIVFSIITLVILINLKISKKV